MRLFRRSWNLSLLNFSHYDQLRASTPTDRLETRLILLEKIEEAREASPGRSVQSAALDVARVTDKVKLARVRSVEFEICIPMRTAGPRHWLSVEKIRRGASDDSFGCWSMKEPSQKRDFMISLISRTLLSTTRHKEHRRRAVLRAQLVLLDAVESYLDAHPNARATARSLKFRNRTIRPLLLKAINSRIFRLLPASSCSWLQNRTPMSFKVFCRGR